MNVNDLWKVGMLSGFMFLFLGDRKWARWWFPRRNRNSNIFLLSCQTLLDRVWLQEFVRTLLPTRICYALFGPGLRKSTVLNNDVAGAPPIKPMSGNKIVNITYGFIMKNELSGWRVTPFTFLPKMSTVGGRGLNPITKNNGCYLWSNTPLA